MIHVIISYKNRSSDKTSVKSHEVAKKYIDAILTVFKHDKLIDDIEKIETIDYHTKESKTVYPEVS
jgi:hypothetical protein